MCSVQVDHIVTGSWSKKAAQEAAKYCEANTVAKGDNKSVPPRDSWKLSDDAVYVHYCDNETIQAGSHCSINVAACTAATGVPRLMCSKILECPEDWQHHRRQQHACPALHPAQRMRQQQRCHAAYSLPVP